MKKRALTLFLALVMCSALCAPVWASENISLLLEPYEEITVAFGPTALASIEDVETRQFFEKHVEDMQLELLEISEKTVYVEESFNENGQYSSRVLNRAEVMQLESPNSVACASSEYVASVSNNSNSRGQLTITFSKSRDARGNYVLNAYAKWNTDNLTSEGSVYPYHGDDYIAIRWGGDNEYLKATSYSFVGKYTDGSSMTGYRELSNTYGGYCWSFDERTATFGKVMDHASVVVVLDGTYTQLQNRETGATFTYIHTYEAKSASWNIGFSGTSFAGGITLSNCDKQWKLSTAVDGIQF